MRSLIKVNFWRVQKSAKLRLVFTILLLIVGLTGFYEIKYARGATFTSYQSGDWSNQCTWSATCNGGVPATADSVVLSSGHVITVSTTVSNSGGISGAGSLVKNSTNTLTLSGTNSFGGGVTLNAGQININSSTALGTGTFTINGGTINNTSGGTITLSTNNAQIWNASFTYPCSSFLNLGTGTVTLGADVTVTTTSGGGYNLTVGGVIQGDYSITKAGGGALFLTGANTYSGVGGTTINAGSLSLSGANSTSGPVYLNSTGTLNINHAQALGTGTFYLNGGRLQGNVTISTNNPQVWNSSFIFGNGSNLNLGTGTVTLNNDIQVDSSYSNYGLTVGGVIQGDYGISKIGSGFLTLTGLNTYSGSAGTTINAGILNLNGASSSSGPITLNTGGRININHAQALGTGTFNINGGSIGNTTGSLVTISTANPQIWNKDFTYAGSSSFNIGTGSVTLNSNILLTNYSSSTTFTVGGAISGDYSITKAGSTGTVEFSGANTFSGGLTVSSGILSLSGVSTSSGTTTISSGSSLYVLNGGALGTGDLVINGGTIANTTGSVTVTTNNTMYWNASFTFGINGGDLNLGTGNVYLGDNITVTHTGDYGGYNAVDGVISGSYGITFRNTNSGHITLNGNNTYTGGTTLNTGGTLDLNGSNNFGTGSVTVNAGTLSLANANTFSGGVTVNGGTLGIKHGQCLGSGTLTINGGALYNSTAGLVSITTSNPQIWNSNFSLNINSQSLNLGDGPVTLMKDVQITAVCNPAAILTVAGVISGDYGVSFMGNKYLVLSGNNNYTGPTQIFNSGALTLSGANTTTGGVVVNAGTLNINHPQALGTGTFTMNGGSIDNTSGADITLTTNNPQVWNANFTHSGITNRGINLGTGNVTLGNNCQITITNNSGTSLTIGGTISGSYNFTKAGNGYLRLSGSSNYTGSTTVSAGVLMLLTDNALPTNTALVMSGGTLDLRGYSVAIGSLTGSSSITSTAAGTMTLTVGGDNTSPAAYSGVIGNGSGTVALNKVGSGSLTLSGSNTYTGSTTVTNGTLISGKLNSFLSTNIAILSSGILDLNNYNLTTAGSASFSTSGTLRIKGDETITNTPTLNIGSTVEYTATSSSRAVKNYAYYNLTINGSGGTFTLPADLTLKGSLTLSAGTFDCSSYNLIVQGDWSKTSGVFTPGSKKVSLTGDAFSHIYGDTTFYDLTLDSSGTTSGKSINFASGSTQTISHTFTLLGATGKLLTLGREGGSGTDLWNFNIANNITAGEYVAVSNSGTANSYKITAGVNNINNGNNPGWIFPVTLSGSLFDDIDGAKILTGKTVYLDINGVVSTNGTVVNGDYSMLIPGTLNANDIISVYISGDSVKASLVTKISQNDNLVNINLYQNYTVVRNETGISQLTNTDLATADNIADSDLLVTVSGSDATFTQGLYIPPTKTFAPGGNVQVAGNIDFSVGTYTPGSYTLTAKGTGNLNAGSNTLNNLRIEDGNSGATTTDTGWVYPQTAADDAGSGGVSTFSNVTNIYSDNNANATANTGPSQSSVRDYSVRLVIGGSVVGDNKADTTNTWPTSETEYTYGSASDKWGQTPTYSNINASDFGVVFASKGAMSVTTHYLKATNFGFNIPSNATIDGITVSLSKYCTSATPSVTTLDYIRIKVSYSVSASPTTTTLTSNVTTSGNVDLISGNFITSGRTLTVGGNLTLTAGSFTASSNTINVGSNLSIADTAVTIGTSTLNFTATTTGKTITTSGTALNNLSFNGAGGGWTLQDALATSGTLSVLNSDISGAGVDFNGKAVGVDGNVVISGGKVTAGASTLRLGGGWNSVGGIFVANTSIITMAATSTGKVINTGSQALNSLVFNGIGGGWSLQSNLTCNSITLTNGNLIDNGMTVMVHGNIVIASTDGLLTSTGNWVQSASGTVSNSQLANRFKNLNIAGTGITSTITSSIYIGNSIPGGGTLTIGSGSLVGGNNSVYLYPANNDFLTVNNPTVVSALNQLYIYQTQNVSQKAITLPNNFATTVNLRNKGFALMATGDWNFGNSALEIDTETVGEPTGYTDMGQYNLTCASINMGTNFGTTFNGYLKLGSGTHNVGNIQRRTGTTSVLNIIDFGSSAVNVSGNIDYTGVNITPQTSTINLTKSSSTQTITSSGQSFYNLSHTGAGTVQLLDALDVNGNLTNTNGTFDANNFNINVAQDFSITGGNFSAGASPTTQTVTLDSPNWSHVYGNNTFRNLTIDTSNVTTNASKSVNFEANKTQTITGTLTLNGASDKWLYLGREGGSGHDYWYFNIPGNMNSGEYIGVNHSNTANSFKITAVANVEDNGWNPGWIFGVAPNTSNDVKLKGVRLKGVRVY